MTRLIFLFLLPLIVLWTACGSDESSDLYERQVTASGDSITLYRGDLPNVVRTHFLSEPKIIHPFIDGTIYRNDVMVYTHEKLQFQDMITGEIVPQLARFVESSDDKLSFTYELLEGIHWPDGESITVADVEFTLKAFLCDKPKRSNLESYLIYTSDFLSDPSNPRRFTVKMNRTFMSNELFGIFFYILDRRIFDPEGVLSPYSVVEVIDPNSAANQDPKVAAWATKMASDEVGQDLTYLQGGSGPYQLVEWTDDQRLRLVRTENYWAAGKSGSHYQQGPEEIVISFLREDQARELRIKQQELDVSVFLTLDMLNGLQASEVATRHYDFKLVPGQGFTSIALNNRPESSNRTPIFNQQQVRLATAMAIDVKSLVADLMGDHTMRSTSPVSPGNFHYEAQPEIPYAADSARVLLDIAGWRDSDGDGIRDSLINGTRVPLRLELLYPPNGQVLIDLTSRIKADLKAVGIDCDLTAMSIGDVFNTMVKGNYDAALFSLGKNDLPYDFHQLFHSSNYPGYNFFGYLNPQVDSLMVAMRTHPDPKARQPLAFEIQRQLRADLPLIPLTYSTKRIAIHKRFTHEGPYSMSPYVLLNTLKVIRPE